MKDLLIDPETKKLTITNRSLGFTTSDSEYFAQILKLRLYIIKGEWYLNNSIGLPYFDEILIKNPNLSRIEDLMKREIIAVTGEQSIKTFNLEYNNITRELTVTFTVQVDEELLTITI